VTVLGTGGLAPIMNGVSETITEFVPDLTLLGLRLTYLRNVRTTSATGAG
jgi:type III pantothenate kinase